MSPAAESMLYKTESTEVTVAVLTGLTAGNHASTNDDGLLGHVFTLFCAAAHAARFTSHAASFLRSSSSPAVTSISTVGRLGSLQSHFAQIWRASFSWRTKKDSWEPITNHESSS